MKERSFTISTNGAVSANVGAHNPYHDCVVLVTYRRGRNSFYISLSHNLHSFAVSTRNMVATISACVTTGA